MKTRVEEQLPALVLQLRDLTILRDADVYLAEAVRRLFGADGRRGDTGALLAALASRAVGSGHSCLDLAGVDRDWLVSLAVVPPAADALAAVDEAVRRCRAAGTDADGLAGFGAGPAPLVRAGDRVYLPRYRAYEQQVAGELRRRAGAPGRAPRLAAAVRKALDRLLDNEPARAAARIALTRTLAIITGGPGTGKTYTAARILALLAMPAGPGGQPPVVRMAAPTGKAAARMDESLRAARAALARQGVALPEFEPACTIERLLGYQANSPYFRHAAANPLPADVVVVDEASMLDLARMAKLLDALKPDTRLVLLGDMHQLASVEPGNVLGDLCTAAALAGCRVELTGSRRFPADSGIGRASAAISRAGTEAEAGQAWEELVRAAAEPADPAGVRARVGLRDDPPAALAAARGGIDPRLQEAVRSGYGPLLAADRPADAFAALAQFRILCPLRRGPYGTETVNRLVESILALRPESGAGVEFYRGRVILVTENDYALRLFNGDVGVVLPDPDGAGGLAAWFETPGPAETGPAYRAIPCGLLPAHETGFAMTVHKAQGSEFDRVLLLMPPDGGSPVLTRELVYTAMTRARRVIDLWCRAPVFTAAVRRRVRRFSGLAAALHDA